MPKPLNKVQEGSREEILERIYLWLEEEGDHTTVECNCLQEIMILLTALAAKKEVGSIANFYHGYDNDIDMRWQGAYNKIME